MLPLSHQNPQAVLQKAKALFEQAQFDAARLHFEAVLQKAPTHAESHIFLSRIAFELGDRDACLWHLDKAAALIPQNPRVWMALADRHRHFGNSDQALAAYDKAIALVPQDVAPKADKAHYLQLLGRFDEADALFGKLIKKHPDQAELYRIMGASKKLTKGHPLVRQMLKLWDHPRLTDTARMHLGYALAKAMEDSGQTDSVFTFLNKANALQAKAAPYDAKARADEVAHVLAAQDGDLSPIAPQITPRPIFVCGMPRSGTTLAEQIIGAHSHVQAGGEMGHALTQAYKRFGGGTQMAPLADQSTEALAEFAHGYARMVTRDHSADSPCITDKSIQSIMIFGLLHRAMPDARLIVILRDPRDIALSIYRNYFALGTHRYACQLADIATEIKLFRSMVRHWQTHLPDALHIIRYEDLVSTPEPTARTLLGAAGVDWEDGCLSFHKSRSVVQTLSTAQVRQPIHAGRREAWRRYETALQPFLDAWGDEPWD